MGWPAPRIVHPALSPWLQVSWILRRGSWKDQLVLFGSTCSLWTCGCIGVRCKSTLCHSVQHHSCVCVHVCAHMCARTRAYLCTRFCLHTSTLGPVRAGLNLGSRGLVGAPLGGSLTKDSCGGQVKVTARSPAHPANSLPEPLGQGAVPACGWAGIYLKGMQTGVGEARRVPLPGNQVPGKHKGAWQS